MISTTTIPLSQEYNKQSRGGERAKKMVKQMELFKNMRNPH
jgi:hypothetical protein